MSTRYTLLLEEGALRDVDRMKETYSLKNRAEVFDMAVRVLSWLTEQQVAGYEIGRAKDDAFQPLLMPYKLDEKRWATFGANVDTPAPSKRAKELPLGLHPSKSFGT